MEFPLLFETLCFMYGKPNPRRFADECDLVYRVALGMTGKAYRISHGIERGESVRKHLTNEQIELLGNYAEIINTFFSSKHCRKHCFLS